MNAPNARNAHVTNDMGGEDNVCGDASDVPAVPDVEAEDACISAMRRAPREPTKQEIDEQHLTDLPFRSWCRGCVAAKAKHLLHRGSSRC